MAKALGLMLTITGLMLAVWFVQQLMASGIAVQLPAFVVAAMAVAMISVGIRYILKKKKPKAEKPSPERKEP